MKNTIYNKQKQLLLEIEQNENTKNFLYNWYFLNKYPEENKFKNAFVVNYV